ncbi:hypothetical protein ACLOJK_041112 [Asimina triloba]
MQLSIMGIRSLCSILLSHPEILLSIACFLFLRTLTNHKMKYGHLINWPLLGMLPQLFLNIHRLHDWTTHILRRDGCTIVFRGPWFAGMDLVGTCDPANVRHIMCTNFSNYPKGPQLARILDVFGDGIITTDYDMWKLQRKMGHSVMHGVDLRRLVAKSSREKVEKGLLPVLHHMLQGGEAFDLQALFQRFTFDITCIFIFGHDPASLSLSLPNIPFSKAMDDAMEAVLIRHAMPESWWMLLRWLNVGPEKKLAEAKKTIDCFVQQQISKTREALSQCKSEMKETTTGAYMTGSIIPTYISRPFEDDETGISKTYKFLRDSAVTFMLGGRDTTSAALTWFFWLVSNNPRVEMNILEELKANFCLSKKQQAPDPSDHDQIKIPTVFDAEELSGLVYLHAALCETLRLFPSVPFEHKFVVHDDVLPSGHMVRSNTKIFLSLFAMGRMESIWGEDCSEFKPERWISEQGKLKHHPAFKFTAFNAGPRLCLGKDIAFTQMKVVATALLYNFHVEVVASHPVKPMSSIILHAKDGLMVKIRKRYAS